MKKKKVQQILLPNQDINDHTELNSFCDSFKICERSTTSLFSPYIDEIWSPQSYHKSLFCQTSKPPTQRVVDCANITKQIVCAISSLALARILYRLVSSAIAPEEGSQASFLARQVCVGHVILRPHTVTKNFVNLCHRIPSLVECQ